MRRRGIVALALLALLGCGRVGPPVRATAAPPSESQPAEPESSEEEQR